MSTILVVFDTAGGSIVSSQVINLGESIKRIDTPFKEGYVFDGWYTSNSYEDDTKWDPESPIFEDVVLYAKWAENTNDKFLNINNNAFQLLDSFDSESLKLSDEIIIGDKRCSLYDNGRVIFDQGVNISVLHIDVSLCTDFGFVKSDDGVVRVYTCAMGLLKIINVETDDIKLIHLPTINYHTLNGSVKMYNGEFYAIIGTLARDSSLHIKKMIKTDRYRTITINKEKYALIYHKLYKAERPLESLNDARYADMVVLEPFNDMVIEDFSVNDNEITVLRNDGRILKSIDGDISTKIDAILKYNPGIDVKSINTESIDLSVTIIDYEDLIMHDVYHSSNLTDNSFYSKRTFFKNCTNGDKVFCTIYKHENQPDKAIVYRVDGNYNSVDTKNYPIIIDDVSYYDPTEPEGSESSFNIPDRVSFSENGIVMIARGTSGLIMIKDGEVINICDNIGLRSGAIITGAIFGKDGYLYMSSKQEGYVLRNRDKGDYSIFHDIVVSSLIVESGHLDTDTRTSNIIATDNGIWFYCTGSHNSGSIINNGLYHYNSSNNALNRVKTYDNSFSIGKKRLFFSDGDVFVCNSVNGIDLYDQYTLEMMVENIILPEEDRIYWDIISYDNDILMYVSDQIEPDMYQSKLISNNSSIDLDVVGNEIDILCTSKITYNIPNISEFIEFGSYTILSKIVSNTALSITTIDETDNVKTERFILPFQVKKGSKIHYSDDGNYLFIHIDNESISWRFDPSKNQITQLGKKNNRSLGNFLMEVDGKVICKSISKTNLRINEGFIAGDNSISDFGALNVNYNSPAVRTTKSFILKKGEGTHDIIIDRVTDQVIKFEDIINLKDNQTFLLPIGIGRDDCKVYLTKNINGDVRLIQEYVTNNKDIVDIDVNPTTTLENYSLLGSVSPGNTIYSNIDYWYVGEINNTAIGVRYQRDGLGNKTSQIELICYLGVKNKFVTIAPTPIEGEVQFFDDTHSSVKIYSKEFGLFYISIDKDNGKIVDIMGRHDPVIQPFSGVTSIFAEGFNIDYESYFESKTHFSKYGDRLILRGHSDGFKSYSYYNPLTRINSGGISIRQSSDNFHIIDSIHSSTQNQVEFMRLDPAYHSADSIGVYIEIDPDYGTMKFNDDKSILNSFKIFVTYSNDEVDEIPLTFTPSANLDNFYSDVFSVASNHEDVVSVHLCVTNYGITTHNTRFRMWSNCIYSKTIEGRTSIGPEPCSVRLNNFFTPIHESTYNDRSFNQLHNGLIVFEPIKNTVTNNRDKFLLVMDLLPSFDEWMMCDKFELFSMGDFKIFAQLADDGILSKVNIDIEGIDFEPISLNIRKDSTLSLHVQYDETGISAGFSQEGIFTEFCNKNTAQFTTDNRNFDILNFFFGEIKNILIVDDIDLYDSPVSFSDFIGNNVFGNVTAMVRDYLSGNLKAIISPTSEGNLRNSGLLEYTLKDDSSEFSRILTKKPINDLQYGELGFHENSAFKLFCYHSDNGKVFNVFERKQSEYRRLYRSKFLTSMDNRRLIDTSKIRLKTSGLW